MKKLIAVVMVLLCASLMFAKEVTKKFYTGTWLDYEFQSWVFVKKQSLTGKSYTDAPKRIYSILPYDSGYVLKLSFEDPEYAYPIIELFVKPGMIFETGNPKCRIIKVVNVKPNEIELCFDVAD